MNSEASDLKPKIFDRIDRAWPQQVDFIRALVNRRSVLGSTNGAMEVVEPRIKDLGLDVARVPIDVEVIESLPGFSPPSWSYDHLYNVIGRLRGSGGGHSLVLNGHLDVVPSTPDEHWTHDPWAGDVDGKFMYGRGAADMKSGVSAIIFALSAVREAGATLGGDVITQFVIDEECSGNGTLACLAAGHAADACIIPEPFGLTAVTAHPGVLWAKITVHGRAAHAALARGAVNSIEKAFLILNALRELEGEVNEEAWRHPEFAGVEHPLNFNFGQLHGGDWTSTVPEVCTLDVRFACWPGEDLKEVQRRFKARVAAVSGGDEWLNRTPPEVTFYGFSAEGAIYDADSAISHAVAINHQNVIGAPLKWRPVTATIDNRFFQLYFQIPSVCYGPVGGNLHAPNEWVDLESVRECTKVIAGTVVDWCGT